MAWEMIHKHTHRHNLTCVNNQPFNWTLLVDRFCAPSLNHIAIGSFRCLIYSIVISIRPSVIFVIHLSIKTVHDIYWLNIWLWCTLFCFCSCCNLHLLFGKLVSNVWETASLQYLVTHIGWRVWSYFIGSRDFHVCVLAFLNVILAKS